MKAYTSFVALTNTQMINPSKNDRLKSFGWTLHGSTILVHNPQNVYNEHM